MSLFVRIGAVECECGYFKRSHRWHREKPATQNCPICGKTLYFVKYKKAHIFGQFSNDITSDLYARPDADCAARELERQAHIIANLERGGKTPKVDDATETKAAIEMYKRYPEYFGDYDKPMQFPVQDPRTDKHIAEQGPSSEKILESIIEKMPGDLRNAKLGVLSGNQRCSDVHSNTAENFSVSEAVED